MHGKASIETLAHFNCGHCGRWWSIGDAPPEKTEWFCPWCGQRQTITLPLAQDEIPNADVTGETSS